MLNTKKYYLETFGCQMNEFDSERLSFLIEGMGYSRTDTLESADIIIINTCSVRAKAENRLYGHIGNLKYLKKLNPGLLICIGGCTAQNLKEKIIMDFPFVDIVFGTQNIEKLPLLIGERLKKARSVCDVEKFDEKSFYNFSRQSGFKAFLPVIIGCDNFCSYCIVPYVRGRERSVNPDIIINKIKELVTCDGVAEIMLLGQNVNSYGQDFSGNSSSRLYGASKKIGFAQLLNDIAAIDGLKRIRFMTSHPKDFSDDLIYVIRDNKNIMNHIHLPIQAGSDKILKLMNRKYSMDDYRTLYGKIKKNIPDCAITTDIIVGFPGEEEGDFYETLEAVKNLRFNRAFTFIYSARIGTRAYDFKDMIPEAKKKIWFKELVEAQNRIAFEENLKLKGRKFEVLVEGHDLKDKGLLKGRLENNNTVNFAGNGSLTGKFTDVLITDVKSFYLIGKTAEK